LYACNLRTNAERITAGIEQISDGKKNKRLNTRQAMEHPRKVCAATAAGWLLTTAACGCSTTTCMKQ